MNQTKRQVLPDGLWIVSTPIGNLMDMTSRACLALREADLIFCEDTRRTRILLSSLGIERHAPLERFDANTPSRQIQAWVTRMQIGGKFALVTDAGTPSVSDPGAVLVALARKAGVGVTPFPGASAVLALLAVSGIQETSFTFRGFFPRKKVEQKNEVELFKLSALRTVVVWFESPLRIVDTLAFLQIEWPDTYIFIAKELTKLHERFFSGSPGEVLEQVQIEVEREGSLGEWCFAVHGLRKASRSDDSLVEDEAWFKTLQCLADCGVSVSESVKKVSQHFGISKKQVYSVALKIFGKK